MKNGWLIINSFIEANKFFEIYDLLLSSSRKYNISLKLIKTDEICCVLGDGIKKAFMPDFAIFWDKDVYVAKLLEKNGVRLFNCAKAIENCDNKAKTCICLHNAGIAIPKTIIAPKTFENIGYNNFRFLDMAISQIGLPLVIKESYGSFGKQVYLANTKEDAINIIKKINHKDFILQEFISTSRGRDIRINVINGKEVSSMLRYNENDFRSNVTNGGKTIPYKPNDKQIEIAVEAVKCLQLDFAGVDMLFGGGGQPVICEVNSNPHFKSTLDCTGVNLADFIMDYIAETLKC